MASSLAVVVVVSLTLSISRVTGFAFSNDACVFLTVSSLWEPAEGEHSAIERQLELNWITDPVCGSPDHLGLFSSDPRSTQDVTALLWIETRQHPDNFYRTNISLGRPSLPGGWDDFGTGTTPTPRTPGDHCFPFWVASFNEIAILHAECLKIRPTWMNDHRAEFGVLGLHELVIPGTHNSACYQHDRGNATAPRRDAFSRYLLTQDSDVWTQLVHGIRYLDLRVGYYAGKELAHNVTDRFWVNHAMVRVAPLAPVLRQIARFLEAAPNEVVVVDLHRFPVGMEKRRRRHRLLVALLRKELGHLALPPSPTRDAYTLDAVWAQRKRVIIAYGESQTAKASKWLWPPLSQQWGSKQTARGLRGYIDEVVVKPRTDPHALWAVMAELTPTPFDVILDVSGSLRKMADSINRNLTAWLRDIWWQRTNIVASDFFLGNHVVDVAVRANQRKAALLN